MRVSANVVVGRIDGEEGCFVEVFGFGDGEVCVRVGGDSGSGYKGGAFLTLDPAEACGVGEHVRRMIQRERGTGVRRLRDVGVLSFVDGETRFTVGYETTGEPFRAGALVSVMEGEVPRREAHAFVTHDLQGLADAFVSVGEHEHRAKPRTRMEEDIPEDGIGLAP